MKNNFEEENIFGIGTPNKDFTKFFIGNSYLNPLTDPKKCNVFLANVTFEPDMVITIPANVKHWHGAKKNSWFSHIVVEVPGEETSNEWCEAISDEEYNKL